MSSRKEIEAALIARVKGIIEIWRIEEFNEPITESDRELHDKVIISLEKMPHEWVQNFIDQSERVWNAVDFRFMGNNKRIDREKWLQMWLEYDEGRSPTCSEETKKYMHRIINDTLVYVIERDLKSALNKLIALRWRFDGTQAEKETMQQKIRDIQCSHMPRVNEKIEEIINL